MPEPSSDDLATCRRRLRFRAWHRGTREADIMIGSFVDQHLDEFSAADCAWFEDLLNQIDQDILDWMTGRRSPPKPFDGPLMRAMMKLEHIHVKH